jgi:hypothetical protein
MHVRTYTLIAVNVKTMVEEGLIGRLVCLSWSHDSRLRQLIGITLKAIFDRYDVRRASRSLPAKLATCAFTDVAFAFVMTAQATIGKSIAIVPSLEQIAIHTIQVRTTRQLCLSRAD